MREVFCESCISVPAWSTGGKQRLLMFEGGVRGPPPLSLGSRSRIWWVCFSGVGLLGVVLFGLLRLAFRQRGPWLLWGLFHHRWINDSGSSAVLISRSGLGSG